MSKMDSFHKTLQSPAEQKQRQIAMAADQLPLVLVDTMNRLTETVNAMTNLFKIDAEVAKKIDEKTPGLSDELIAAKEKLTALIKEVMPSNTEKITS